MYFLIHTDSNAGYLRGVETLIWESESSGRKSFPATAIAISLLVGFMFMLVAEQLLPSAHSHSGVYANAPGLLSPGNSTVEFDAEVELGEVHEDSTRSPRPADIQPPTAHRTAAEDWIKFPITSKGFTLTLGLVFHALSDGLALGSSIVSDAGSQDLSLVIFVTLVIHKGTTASPVYLVGFPF